MTGKKGNTHYLLEIKREAVRLFLEERRTGAKITKLLGMRSKKRVEAWVSQYRHFCPLWAEGQVTSLDSSRVSPVA